MPVYNEAAAARQALVTIVAKQIPGWNLEIVIVESNSTDGSRDIVLAYRDHPRVRLVLEDAPRGRGHVVRHGFAHMTDDAVLIQDADLEYDPAGYDALLAAIAAGRHSFVLGSRHARRRWFIRKFDDQVGRAFVLNAAHWPFTY